MQYFDFMVLVILDGISSFSFFKKNKIILFSQARPAPAAAAAKHTSRPHITLCIGQVISFDFLNLIHEKEQKNKYYFRV